LFNESFNIKIYVHFLKICFNGWKLWYSVILKYKVKAYGYNSKSKFEDNDYFQGIIFRFNDSV
jgi:hypothetical protein